jgi:NADH dehydrogenase FAD-containing subunit
VSVRETVRQLLGRRAITLIEGITVTGWDGATALLEDGTRVPCDLALLATGVQPPPVLRRFGLPVADDGSLRVNRYLQSVGAPEVFGGGDCVTLTDHPLARVGVYAVRQGPILYRNLAAVLTGGTLVPFIPQRHFLQILNLGDGTALLTRNGFVWRSRLALWLKSYIDRKFVAEYRLS